MLIPFVWNLGNQQISKPGIAVYQDPILLYYIDIRLQYRCQKPHHFLDALLNLFDFP